MKVLVINCGSSSLKYQVLNMDGEILMAKGLVERIGMEGSVINHTKIGQDKWVNEVDMPTHKEAIQQVMDALLDADHGVVASMDEIDAIGHRIAHGGESFTKSTYISDEVMAELPATFELAPLHNPANVLGMEACAEVMPGKPQVLVPDTAFHQTMPKASYMYALPYEAYEKYGVRKYGFHGTSHRYVSQRAAEMLNMNIEDLNIVTMHMGNGGSAAAVKAGKCIDTSMGFTPQGGLVMGTRCGDIDPAIVGIIADKENLDTDGIADYINKKSGMLGLSGISSDFRDIEAAAEEGNERAQLALDVFVQRAKFYIGAYAAEMNGMDVIVFTAGIGENDVMVREAICADMDRMGVKLDPAKNNVRGEETIISADDSPVKVLLIPTNEELVIARDTVEIVSAMK